MPVFSLYGEVRRPTGQTLETFDVFLVDLQDLGCRIYTFITTCSTCRKRRPARQERYGCSTGPTGRAPGRGRRCSGLGKLRGRRAAADAARADARRAGAWFVGHARARRRVSGDRDGGLAARDGARVRLASESASGSTPAPTRANLNMARAYAGTVMLEGTTLSEGGGRPARWSCSAPRTSTPRRILAEMRALAPEWLAGCASRGLLPANLPQACRQALPRRR